MVGKNMSIYLKLVSFGVWGMNKLLSGLYIFHWIHLQTNYSISHLSLAFWSASCKACISAFKPASRKGAFRDHKIPSKPIKKTHGDFGRLLWRTENRCANTWQSSHFFRCFLFLVVKNEWKNEQTWIKDIIHWAPKNNILKTVVKKKTEGKLKHPNHWLNNIT